MLNKVIQLLFLKHFESLIWFIVFVLFILYATTPILADFLLCLFIVMYAFGAYISKFNSYRNGQIALVFIICALLFEAIAESSYSSKWITISFFLFSLNICSDYFQMVFKNTKLSQRLAENRLKLVPEYTDDLDSIERINTLVSLFSASSRKIYMGVTTVLIVYISYMVFKNIDYLQLNNVLKILILKIGGLTIVLISILSYLIHKTNNINVLRSLTKLILVVVFSITLSSSLILRSTLNAAKDIPYITEISPSSGVMWKEIWLKGNNFKGPISDGYKVIITDSQNKEHQQRVVKWTNDLVIFVVDPTNTPTGDVKIIVEDKESNTLPFTYKSL